MCLVCHSYILLCLCLVYHMIVSYYFFFVCFFFFKQKTAYEMRISDWSSDVCSSDLLAPHDRDEAKAERRPLGDADQLAPDAFGQRPAQRRSEERRVGKQCVSSVDLGGRRIIKKKNKK